MLLSISLHATKSSIFQGSTEQFTEFKYSNLFKSYQYLHHNHLMGVSIVCLLWKPTFSYKINAIIILSKMITIENGHFPSKQDFHLELSPIGDLKSFMSGPPVGKETLVLISTIHRRLAQLGLTISKIHRRVAQLGLTISTIHRRVAQKELRANFKILLSRECKGVHKYTNYFIHNFHDTPIPNQIQPFVDTQDLTHHLVDFWPHWIL